METIEAALQKAVGRKPAGEPGGRLSAPHRLSPDAGAGGGRGPFRAGQSAR